MSSSFRDLRRDAPLFPTYFATAVMARLANEGLRLALILAAADTPAGLKLGGLLVAAFLIPSVVAAPFVGRLADISSNPKRLYALAFAFNGIVIALCGLLLNAVHPAVVLIIAAIGGTVGPLMQGGLSSLVGAIVPKPLLPKGYALDVVSYNVSAILAPAIVAVVASVVSPLASLLLLSVLMFCASVNVLRLGIKRNDDRALIAAPSPAEGFRAIARIVPLRSTVTATSLSAIGVGILPIAATKLAMDTFSVNAGVMLSTMAIGALIGSLAYAMRPFVTDEPHRLVPVITLVTAAPIAILAMTSSTIIALALLAFAGALGGPSGTAQFSVRDRFSPSNVRTQVFTLSTSIKTTFAATGAALAGVISGASPALLLLIAVSANVLGGLIAIFDLKAGGWMKSPVSRDVGISEVQPPSRIRDARGSD
jgi:MFS family permease